MSKQLAAPEGHAMPGLAASNAGVLPADAVYEILLRVPAKDLCRFRAACRPWRSLLSDPHFAAAHAARHHPAPLIVAGYHAASSDHGFLCDVVDLSGRVVKRVRRTSADNEFEWVVFAQQDLIGTVKWLPTSFNLLNPANGAVHALPEGLAEEHAKMDIDIRHYRIGIIFGPVASTGEYKGALCA